MDSLCVSDASRPREKVGRTIIRNSGHFCWVSPSSDACHLGGAVVVYLSRLGKLAQILADNSRMIERMYVFYFIDHFQGCGCKMNISFLEHSANSVRLRIEYMQNPR